MDCIDEKSNLNNVAGIWFKENGRMVTTPARRPWLNIDEIAFPDWDLFDVKTYLDNSKKFVVEPFPMPYEKIRQIPVNTARGCPFNCTFCYHCFKDYEYRYRSHENIIEEIAMHLAKYDVNYITFGDELTFMNRIQADLLVTAIINSGLKFFWVGQCRGGLFREQDIELAKKIKQSGCVALGYSLESANSEILKAMNKKMNIAEFSVQKKVLDDAGVVSYTSLVLGYPQETEETLSQTFDFCYEHNLYPSVGFILPQPKTPMYEVAKAMGLIDDDETYLLALGDRQDLRINMTNLSNGKIEKLVQKHLYRISNKLNLGLDKDHLIKTERYKYTRKNNSLS